MKRQYDAMVTGDLALIGLPGYPKDGTYADLLLWHLFVWGTRPHGSPTERDQQLWTEEEFKVAVFGDGKEITDEEILRRGKNYNNWTGKGEKVAPGEFYHSKIVNALFEEEPKFEIWSADLRASMSRSRPKHNNIATLKIEEAVAQILRFKNDQEHDPDRKTWRNDKTNPPSPSKLRPKLDFLKYNISQERLAVLSETPERWRERFEPVTMAEVMGYEVRTVSTASILALVDQKLSGNRPLKFPERLKLAEHLALAMPDRDRATAAALLADETPFEHFSAELVRAGWATASQVGHNRLRSRRLLLEAFKPFGLRAGGLIVGDDMTIHAVKLGETRGMDIPQMEDIASLQSISVGSQVGLFVENLAAPRGLLLLEIGPMQDDGLHPITSLVPSILAPQCAVLPGQILPTEPVLGVNRFIARKPVGRYDWLAILTLTPLSPAWPHSGSNLHRLSENEVEWLIETLEEQLRNAGAAAALEVRHHAFRIHEKSA